MNKIKQKTLIANVIRDTLIEFQRQRLLEIHTQLTKSCQQLNEMQAEAGKLAKSLEHNWLNAAKATSDRTGRLLNDISYSIQRTKQFTDQRAQDIPTLACIYEELGQLEQEFDGVEFNIHEYYISVNTTPITLEDIYLGPFQIKLDLEKLNSLHKDSPYYIIALDPNPAATSSEVTHPHVSDEKLCEGDGYTSIRAALQQGRLTDFFTMVKGILTTYNPDSPYVSLDDWQGVACYDCGYTMDSESCYYCYRCERDYCSECSTYCHSCDEMVCLGCISKCEICEEPFCWGCIKECSQCGERCCDSCMEDGICTNCKQEKETCNGQENEEENQAESQTADREKVGAAVLPDSVGKAIVLSGQDR